MELSNSILQTIISAIGADHIKRGELMSRHTTMEVGGPAAWFFTPADETGIRILLKELRSEQIPYYILGKGSNVICRDEGFAGAVICLTENFKGFRVIREDDRTADVAVKAGTLNKDFSDAMIRKGLAGFEFASGIPGSVGGATAMNAGAYDGEFRQIVKEVRLLDPEGRIVTRTCDEMDFRYRHSLASEENYVILETVLTLTREDPERIRSRVEDLTRKREEKQPLEYPSCGSTFKRPEGYFAGKLISDAGLKGYRHGGAQVSEKHAGFVINRDHASAKDILELIAYIRRTVQESQGVTLECEVKIL